MKDKMNICMISNGHVFAVNLGILITSILVNSNEEDEFCFHIITEDMSDNDRNKLIQLKYIKDFDIKFYSPDKERIKVYREWEKMAKAKMPSYWGHSAFLRFEIMHLLKDLDKVVNMDVDIVVLKSLREIFDTNIDNHAILCIEREKNIYQYLRDEVYTKSSNMNMKKYNENELKEENDNSKKYLEKIGILDKYPEETICAGFIYMNLKYMRENISYEDMDKYFYKLIELNVDRILEDMFLNYFIPNDKVIRIDEKYQAVMAIWRKEENCDVYAAHYSCGKVFEPSCYYIPKEKNSLLLKGWKYLTMTPWFKEDPIYFMNIFNQYDNICLERKINEIVDIMVWLIPIKSIIDKIRKMIEEA